MHSVTVPPPPRSAARADAVARTAAAYAIQRWHCDAGFTATDDHVATEEPLLVRVGGRNVAVIMRTPGDDRELVAGFLLTEGVITRRDDLLDVLLCRELAEGAQVNVAEVVLAPGRTVDFERLTRHVFSGSSCGVCGKTTLDAVFATLPPVRPGPRFDPRVLARLPAALRPAQPAFGATGGLHASALFSTDGDLLGIREDIGRHNALDKLLGRALLESALPLAGYALLLSGRVSFELVQKSATAGIPLIAGIGAPSSLAVECARRAGQTLVGFVRDDRFNVYCGAERL